MPEHTKRKFYKRPLFIVPAVLAVLVVGGIAIGANKKSVLEFSGSVVERIDLTQSVEETGSIVADLELEYGWETSGRVAAVLKKEGDILKKNDVIAELASALQGNSVAQARATLAAAPARLDERVIGPSDEGINQSLASVSKAAASVAQAEADLEKIKISGPAAIDTAEKAYQTAKNNLQLATGGENSKIVEDAYDDFLNTLRETIPVLADALTEVDNIIGVDNQLANDTFESSLARLNMSVLQKAKSSYAIAKNKKIMADQALAVLTSGSKHAAVESAQVLVEDATSATLLNLIDTQSVLDSTLPNADLSQTSLNTYKTDINTAKTNVSAKRTAVTNGAQSVTTAKNSLKTYEIAFEKALQDWDVAKATALIDEKRYEALVDIQRAAFKQAQASHDALVAKPRTVDIAALRADVAKTQAQLASAEIEFEKTRLRALTDGVLARLNMEVGENITAQVQVAKIVSSALSVDVDISESDVAKVSVSDEVFVTLDAFGDDRVLQGTVVSVEPSETEVSGVIYYTTHIAFSNAQVMDDVRPGMTANINIITETKKDVLVIPQRAVLEQEGKKIVRVVKEVAAGVFEEREVTTGLRGDEGKIEIISGLSEGENIVTFLKEKSTP